VCVCVECVWSVCVGMCGCRCVSVGVCGWECVGDVHIYTEWRILQNFLLNYAGGTLAAIMNSSLGVDIEGTKQPTCSLLKRDGKTKSK